MLETEPCVAYGASVCSTTALDTIYLLAMTKFHATLCSWRWPWRTIPAPTLSVGGPLWTARLGGTGVHPRLCTGYIGILTAGTQVLLDICFVFVKFIFLCIMSLWRSEDNLACHFQKSHPCPLNQASRWPLSSGLQDLTSGLMLCKKGAPWFGGKYFTDWAYLTASGLCSR